MSHSCAARILPSASFVYLAVFLLAAGPPAGLAAPREAELAPEQELVAEALHREIYGLRGERDRLLSEALVRNPDYGPAKWHLGFVHHNRQWVTVDAVTSSGEVPAGLKQYELRRDAMRDDLPGHLALANWCRAHDLPLQEQAHLWRMLDLNPDHRVARERLGFRLSGGVWLSVDELREAAERREREAEAGDKWRRELIEIRRDLVHAQPQRRASARTRLRHIPDVDAIPMMEEVLSLSSEEGALAVLDAVSGWGGPESVQSLIRHAVLAESPLVREAAAEQLRQRQRDSYVPTLLAAMYTPVVSRFGMGRLPGGRWGYRHVFEREGQEERQLLVLDTDYRRVRRVGGSGEESLFRAFTHAVVGLTQREASVAQQNALQAAVNERCASALNLATNQQLPADPQRWWKWWDQENDVARQGGKQRVERQQTQQLAVVDRTLQLGTQLASQADEGGQRVECFAAGTPVLTQHGLRAIESIRVGDVVVAQDVDTGELAFKPVLRTTIRPAGKLLRVEVGSDVLETTSGHPFWGVGQGWVKARQLQSGMEVHCLRGALPQTVSESSREAPTYNLVVADFHTYFVGQERVLSHDVTQRRPTSAIVPGLRTE